MTQCVTFAGYIGQLLYFRVRARQAKSVFLKKFEKRQAKSVFLFKNLRMSVFVSSNAWKKIFDIENLRIF